MLVRTLGLEEQRVAIGASRLMTEAAVSWSREKNVRSQEIAGSVVEMMF